MAEDAVLFPEREYRVQSGRSVVVKPWGMATGRRLAPRVAKLFEGLGADFSTGALSGLVVKFQDEVYEIVRETLGVEDDAMEKFSYEDLFTLFTAVLEVCVLRTGEDGQTEGAGGKLLALVGALNRQARGTSPGQSSSSVPTVTTPLPSESTPTTK